MYFVYPVMTYFKSPLYLRGRLARYKPRPDMYVLVYLLSSSLSPMATNLMRTMKASLISLLSVTAVANTVLGQNVDACPGYNATNISNMGNGFNADLVLAGPACNVYGPDLKKLTLSVSYETGKQLSGFYRHVFLNSITRQSHSYEDC
jgi:hypothetical protein